MTIDDYSNIILSNPSVKAQYEKFKNVEASNLQIWKPNAKLNIYEQDI